jgi:TrpR-related protein YerC/YecD
MTTDTKSKFMNDDIRFLYEMILSLENEEECSNFFEDLCTIREIQDMALRLKVARMLDCKVSYQIITSETYASTATIGRVNKSLIYGANGYRVLFDRYKQKKSKICKDE